MPTEQQKLLKKAIYPYTVEAGRDTRDLTRIGRAWQLTGIDVQVLSAIHANPGIRSDVLAVLCGLEGSQQRRAAGVLSGKGYVRAESTDGGKPTAGVRNVFWTTPAGARAIETIVHRANKKRMEQFNGA